MTQPEDNPSDFQRPEFPPVDPHHELTPDEARQANQTFLQGQGSEAAHPARISSQSFNTPGTERGGSFFGALFDFTFRRYVTPSVAQALYLVLFIVIGVVMAVALLGALSVLFSGQPFAVNLLVFILAVPPIVLVGVAVLALCRVYLEVAVALIRTSQSVQAIDARQEQRLQELRAKEQ